MQESKLYIDKKEQAHF